jgi:hypothetical protein
MWAPPEEKDPIVTHNQYFAALDDLRAAVTKQRVEWGKPNRVLAKLCCLAA